jgi:hypothetical protein
MEGESFDNALENEMTRVFGPTETKDLISRMGVCTLAAFKALTFLRTRTRGDHLINEQFERKRKEIIDKMSKQLCSNPPLSVTREEQDTKLSPEELDALEESERLESAKEGRSLSVSLSLNSI